ncbi:MAG: zinc-dependent metalloprotease, partial [Longimicrobiales bacterium]|nr:zinc-dependent metalloprotease [Longimicrobiales bacterium]
LRYSVFALPEEPMMRRLAEDRLGYFLSAQRNYSIDHSPDPYVRYVNRWRLEKADPDAELSEPVEPIVFYVDRSVPAEYRRYVAEGIEAWNKGFEAAGFRNAIVAMDPPDDSTWSAEDVRYSTVRWTAAHEMGYAIGPSQVDPRSGEILNADILISSTFVTGWTNEWNEFVADAALAERYPEAGYFGGLWGRLMAAESLARELPAHQRERLCVAALGRAHQIGFQHAVLAATGVIAGNEPLPEDYLGTAIRDLVMHEVGHTLGLRHNFKASAAVPYDRLNDEAFTRENGVYVSVMDYAPTNINPDRSEQGHYLNPEIGAYDVWVIQYGYMPVPGAETPEDEQPVLDELAARASTDPLLTYNTDEDTHLGPLALDPLSNTYDLSAEPMAYARSRAELVEIVKPEMEARLIDQGEGWQRLRSAVPGLIFERYGSLVPVTKAVGGMYFHRDHKGQPEARLPFEPVAAADQRDALAFIIEEAFAPGAFAFEAETLNKLPPDRWGDWSGSFFTAPIDYPIHGTIAAVQGSLLNMLMHNGRLIRMIDNEVRMMDAEPYTVADLFGTLTDGIWTEAGWSGRRATNVDSYRRNLQRIYVTQLIDKALDRVSGQRSSFNPSTPEDARSLARYELQRLSDRLGQVMDAGSLNRVTRAHFAETKVRIDQALEADLVIESS